MKFVGIFMLVVATSASFMMPNDSDEVFLKFLSDFNIELSPFNDYQARKEIFMENLMKIREHNQRYLEGKELFEMGVNQFTHMSVEEKTEFSGGLRLLDESERVFSSKRRGFLINITAPEAYDYRAQNKVTPIQNQVSGHILK